MGKCFASVLAGSDPGAGGGITYSVIEYLPRVTACGLSVDVTFSVATEGAIARRVPR
jgi:hypothetical protein